MKNPFSVVKDFEDAVAEYTGAPYCVAVNSCTNALFLALVYSMKWERENAKWNGEKWDNVLSVEIPKHTYVSVPMQIKLAGFNVLFRDEDWEGMYQLKPFNIYDAARRFTSNMFDFYANAEPRRYICVSFHWSKILGIQQGGAILHNNHDFDAWARRARFDGRTEGVVPNGDKFDMLGYHCYMSPEIAAEGLVRLHHLPKHNEDLPNDDYPDLSTIELFK